MQGRMSPSWETISAPRHIFLMLVTPVHHLTFTEVRRQLACVLHGTSA